MNFLKKIILVLIFLFPISNSFGAMVTLVDNLNVSLDTTSDKEITGIQFNSDGTKAFISFYRDASGGTDYSWIDEYNLSVPYDVSTGTYAGDSERCDVNHGLQASSGHNPFTFQFSADGTKFFMANRRHTTAGAGYTNMDRNFVFRFDLTTPYDISTCSYAQRTSNLFLDANLDGSNAGPNPNDEGHKNTRLQGVAISSDGKKMFTLTNNDRVREYNLSTPFDLTTFSLVISAGINLTGTTNNPMGITFSATVSYTHLTLPTKA